MLLGGHVARGACYQPAPEASHQTEQKARQQGARGVCVQAGGEGGQVTRRRKRRDRKWRGGHEIVVHVEALEAATVTPRVASQTGRHPGGTGVRPGLRQDAGHVLRVRRGIDHFHSQRIHRPHLYVVNSAGGPEPERRATHPVPQHIRQRRERRL